MTKKPSELIREKVNVPHKPYWPVPGGAPECARCGEQNFDGIFCDTEDQHLGMLMYKMDMKLWHQIHKAYALGCSREFLADCLEAKGL